jgi:hypothetical protein
MAGAHHHDASGDLLTLCLTNSPLDRRSLARLRSRRGS